MEKTITAADGRKLCILETGKLDGIPVLTHHGVPGSRYPMAEWSADALNRGIRLICYDRPGYGGSDPQPGRTVGDCAADVESIAKALGLGRLLVWGGSGGGPHALACAALLPHLVAATAVLASPAPYPAEGLDWFAGMAVDNHSEYNAAREGREALMRFVNTTAQMMIHGPFPMLYLVFQSYLAPADLTVFDKPFAREMLTRFRAGVKDGREGWADDDLAYMKPWGFDLGSIRMPTLLLHGKEDRMVPLAHGEWLAQRIPGVQAFYPSDEGHLSITSHWVPEAHRWLLNRW